jgi:hypothetical protein
VRVPDAGFQMPDAEYRHLELDIPNFKSFVILCFRDDKGFFIKRKKLSIKALIASIKHKKRKYP